MKYRFIMTHKQGQPVQFRQRLLVHTQNIAHLIPVPASALLGARDADIGRAFFVAVGGDGVDTEQAGRAGRGQSRFGQELQGRGFGVERLHDGFIADAVGRAETGSQFIGDNIDGRRRIEQDFALKPNGIPYRRRDGDGGGRGAEVQLFEGDMAWLDRVGCLAIEFHHTTRANTDFDALIARHGFYIVSDDSHTVVALNKTRNTS